MISLHYATSLYHLVSVLLQRVVSACSIQDCCNNYFFSDAYTGRLVQPQSLCCSPMQQSQTTGKAFSVRDSVWLLHKQCPYYCNETTGRLWFQCCLSSYPPTSSSLHLLYTLNWTPSLLPLFLFPLSLPTLLSPLSLSSPPLPPPLPTSLPSPPLPLPPPLPFSPPCTQSTSSCTTPAKWWHFHSTWLCYH